MTNSAFQSGDARKTPLSALATYCVKGEWLKPKVSSTVHLRLDEFKENNRHYNC